MANYFYTDDKKTIIKEELLTTKAKSWAESFIKPKVLYININGKDKPNYKLNPPLTSSQLRKFHTESKTLEEKIKNDEFSKFRPLVKMLKAKVAYACPSKAKKNDDRKVPEEFRRYIEEMVDNIEDVKDFKAFALCFEAVVGFFYGQGGR